MFETLLDCMPIDEVQNYIVVKINHEEDDDDTMSVLMFDDPHELNYCGIDDIRDLSLGVSYNYEDEDGKFDIIRAL